MLVDKESSLQIKKTYLAYYNLGLSYTSALGYYEESLNAIVKAMKVNLELEQPEIIKTFDISYSENYSTPLIGYGLTGKKESVLPNFIGYDSFYVDYWCLNNGITCYFNKVESEVDKNQIIAQSTKGELLERVSVVYFDVSNGTTTKETTPVQEEKEEKKEEPKKEEPKKEEKPEEKEEEPEEKEEEKSEEKEENNNNNNNNEDEVPNE